MRVTLISPPHVPMYINTDYNFVEIGEQVGYLQQQGLADIQVVDGMAPGQTWAGVIESLLTEPDLLIIHCAPENMTEVARLITIARELLPNIRIACYGRGAFHVSHLLERIEVDFIVMNQDWEVALFDIVKSVEGDHRGPIQGAKVRTDGGYIFGGLGKSLHGYWALPALESLPISSYKSLPGDEQGTRGAGEDFEFAIGISRGCDAACGYCPIPRVMGSREIFRQNLEETVSYLHNAFTDYSFTSVSLFGANFTYDSGYVARFCETILTSPRKINWKCVTSPAFLDEPLIEMMARSNCTRIAVGVESLRPDGTNRFPGRISASELRRLGLICERHKIDLVCFVMVGLPGQGREEIAYTLDSVTDSRAVPRPMIYYDFRRLHHVEHFDEVFWSNRKAMGATGTRRSVPMYELMQIANDWPKWIGAYRRASQGGSSSSALELDTLS